MIKNILVQSSLHRFYPLVQSFVSQLATLLMEFFIVLVSTSKRAIIVEATHHHLVYQSLAYQIFLSRLDLSGAGGTFPFFRSTSKAKCMPARMEPLSILHQGLADGAVEILCIVLINKLVFFYRRSLVFVWLDFGNTACTSYLPHKRVNFIFNIFKHEQLINSSLPTAFKSRVSQPRIRKNSCYISLKKQIYS